MSLPSSQPANGSCSEDGELGRSPMRGRGRRRSAIAATELALAVPILLLFAGAAADFGRVAYYQEALANAARTGGETGATHQFTSYTRPMWEAEVRQAVVDEMASLPGFNDGDLTYELSTTIDADGLAKIVVEVGYPFHTAVAWPGLTEEVNLHERYETRQFR